MQSTTCTGSTVWMPATIAAPVSVGVYATAAAIGSPSAATQEVVREHRSGERRVGDGLAERLGDDRRFRAARDGGAVARVVAQLEPARVAHGGGQPGAPIVVFESGDGPGAELPRELPRRPAQLGLLGRIPRVHFSRSRSRAAQRRWPSAR